MGLLGDKTSNNLRVIDCSLRLFVIPFTMASLWLTVTNHQEDSNYGDLVYSDLSGLKYLVCISAVSAGYAVVGAVSLWVRCLVTKAWIFFVSDQVAAYLMVTSAATAAEILYLAYNGDQEVTWSEACSTFGRFCNRLKIALALQVIALCCFLILAVISAYRLFSRYSPPSSTTTTTTNNNEYEEEN